MLDQLHQFAATEEAASEAGGIAALGIDPIAILIQSGTFLLLFFLIKRYAFDHISQLLDQRDETINEGLENARKASKASEDALAEQQKTLQQASQQAGTIINDANQKSSQIIADAQAAATQQSQKIVDDARTQIQAEVERARQELKSDLIGLVADATATVASQKVDAKADKQLISAALKEAGK